MLVGQKQDKWGKKEKEKSALTFQGLFHICSKFITTSSLTVTGMARITEVVWGHL